MKKTITLVLLFTLTSFSGWAQSITITSIASSVQAGNNLTVNYKYTSTVACKISCGVYLYSEPSGIWTYVLTVVYAEKNSLPAGTNLTGTFDLLIPAGTEPTANLTGTENYKVQPVLSKPDGTWLAGDYTKNNYNITAGTAPFVKVTSIPTSVKAGTDLVVNYKYNALSGGKISVVVTKNGGTNAYDYISTVAFVELNPATAGTYLTGTFTVPIPANTTPTASLTGNENYRIAIELKDASNVFVAGDYSTLNYSITSSLGVNDFDYNKLSAYPNPVDTILKIANTSDLSNPSFRILNISGQTVQKSKILNEEGIDVSGLNSGVYMLSVDSDEGNKQIKFIKK